MNQPIATGGSAASTSTAATEAEPNQLSERMGTADMAMYAAIVGKVPEIDPNAPKPLAPVHDAHRENPWSPIVLSLYLREVYRQGALKLNKPEIAAWIKKQSETAVKRFHETQVRLAAARKDRAA